MLNSNRSTKECPDCRGDTLCYKCEGTGEYHLPAEELGEGIADIATRLFSFFTVDGVEFDHTCPVCKGEKQCQRCGGSGEVIDTDAEEDLEGSDDISSNDDVEHESYSSDYDTYNEDDDDDDFSTSRSNYSASTEIVEEDDELFFYRIAWLKSNGLIKNLLGHLAIGNDGSLYLLSCTIHAGFDRIIAPTTITEHTIASAQAAIKLLYECYFYYPFENQSFSQIIEHYYREYENDKLEYVSMENVFYSGNDRSSDEIEYRVEWRFLDD